MPDRPDAAGETQAAPNYSALVACLTLIVRDADAARRIADEAYLRAGPRVPDVPAAEGDRLQAESFALALADLRRHGQVGRSPGDRASIEAQAPPWVPPHLADAWFALGSLQPQPRMALLLVEVDGLDDEAAAQVLRTTPATIHAWHALALQRIGGPDGPGGAGDGLRRILVELEGAAPRPAGPPDLRRLVRRRRWRRASLAAIVLLIVVGGGYGASRLLTPTVSPSPSALLSPTASPTPSVSLTLDVVPFSDLDADLHGISVMGDQVVITGGRTDGTPAAWIGDGLTFTPASVRTTLSGVPAGPMGPAAWRGGLALAPGPDRPASTPSGVETLLWRSTDDGRSWVLDGTNAVPAAVRTLIFTPAGFVALATPPLGPGDTVAWASSDGTSWTGMVTAGQLPGAEVVGAVASDGTRWVLGGMASQQPAIWTSVGGGSSPSRWTRAELPQATGGQIYAVNADGGFAAIGGSDPATLWTSSDGLTWTARTLASGKAYPSAITSTPDGWAIAGLALPTPTTGTGLGPIIWYVPRTPGLSVIGHPNVGAAQIIELVWFRGRVLGAGACLQGASCQPVILRATIGPAR